MKNSNQPPVAVRRTSVDWISDLDDESGDARWAMALLRGHLEYRSDTRILRRKDISGGEHEHKARMALFRVLVRAGDLIHAHDESRVLHELAAMAAPTFRLDEPPPTWRQLARGTPTFPPGHPKTHLSDRMLTFSRRVKRSHMERDSSVYIKLREKLITRGTESTRIKGMSVEKACAEVAEEVGLSFDTVCSIWKKSGGLKRLNRRIRKKGI